MDEKQVTLRVPETVWEGVNDSAAKNRRSLNGEIVLALEYWLQSQPHRDRFAVKREAALCAICGEPLPLKATGRPRRYHEGECERIGATGRVQAMRARQRGEAP